MPDISELMMPDGVLRDIKDTTARSQIGDLSDLETENKDSLVKAINEASQSGGQLTPAEKSEIVAEATAAAISGAASPVFVSSTDDMTDQSKVYVMDGFVYAYQYTEISGGADYTNLFDASTVTDNARLNSSGAISTSGSLGFVSDYIEAVTGDVIRVKSPGGTYLEGVGLNQPVIDLYDSDKAFIAGFYGNQTAYLTIDDDGAGFSHTIARANVAYIRVAGNPVGNYAGFVVTVNEEIVETESTSGYDWVNTGYSYAPADYQDVITALQKRVSALESVANSGSDIPAYVQAEAEDTADKVLTHRSGQSLVLIAMSDLHIPLNAAAYAAIQHAGQGAKALRDITDVDGVLMMGDYIRGASDSTADEAKAAHKYVHQQLANVCCGIPALWLLGNHDMQIQAATADELTPSQMQAYVGGQNRRAITPDGLYGYLDFEQQKIRVVYLNTSDSTTSYVALSAAQAQWIADNAFDLSDKADPTAWGVLVASHVPLTCASFPDLIAVRTMCEAYHAGESGSVTVGGAAVNYNFSTHGELLGFVHGHTHNFITTQINGFWHLSVPNACPGRENEYASYTDGLEVWGEFAGGNPVYYTKTAGTGDDTSFVVITIDRANSKIYCDCYGAGCDREVSY